MKTVGYFAGALALGGGMVVASEAAAKVYVDNTFIAAGNYGTVNLPGSSSLGYKQGTPGTFIEPSGYAGLGSFTNSSTLPTQGTTFSGIYLDVAQPAAQGSGLVLDDPSDPYLTFSYVNHGNTFDGVATFDGSGDLVSTAYQVPEPETWALLIAGVGMAGGALRRRRRTVSALA
jgi:hypothetical protein